MTLTNNYAHAIMKQKKTKTDHLPGISVFVLLLINQALLRSHFKNSSFVFHQDFQTFEIIKALGLRPHASISFLMFVDPDETLTLVYEILCNLSPLFKKSRYSSLSSIHFQTHSIPQKNSRSTKVFFFPVKKNSLHFKWLFQRRDFQLITN